MQFVIQLKNGSYWISRDGNAVTGHIDAATRFDSRWVALQEMARAGPIMHEAAIMPYERPSKRIEKASS